MAKAIKAKKKSKKVKSDPLDAAFHVAKAGFAFALVEQSPEFAEGTIVAVMKTDVSFQDGGQGDFTKAQKKALYELGLKSILEIVDAGNNDPANIAEGKKYSQTLLTREQHMTWVEENNEAHDAAAAESGEIRLGFGEDDDDDYGDLRSDDDGPEDGKGEDDFDDGEKVGSAPEDKKGI
jgi:hypothetical protein